MTRRRKSDRKVPAEPALWHWATEMAKQRATPRNRWLKNVIRDEVTRLSATMIEPSYLHLASEVPLTTPNPPAGEGHRRGMGMVFDHDLEAASGKLADRYDLRDATHLRGLIILAKWYEDRGDIPPAQPEPDPEPTTMTLVERVKRLEELVGLE